MVLSGIGTWLVQSNSVMGPGFGIGRHRAEEIRKGRCRRAEWEWSEN